MAVESTVTWWEIVQTRAEAETMAETMVETTEERNGKEVRFSRSRIGVVADEVLAKEDEDMVNEDKAGTGNNAITAQVNTTQIIHTTRATMTKKLDLS